MNHHDHEPPRTPSSAAVAIRTVLLVDDEDDIRTIASLCLEKIGGWQVTCARSGVEAIARAGESAFDVVLIDVMMPGMDGTQTFRHLVGTGLVDGHRVLFMTAKAQPDEVAHYLSLGTAGVIRKPFDPMSLAEQVRAAIIEAA